MRECVSCGVPYSGCNHKCSKQHEAGKQAAHTRMNNDELRCSYEPMRIQEATRLFDGLRILEESA